MGNWKTFTHRDNYFINHFQHQAQFNLLIMVNFSLFGFQVILLVPSVENICVAINSFVTLTFKLWVLMRVSVMSVFIWQHQLFTPIYKTSDKYFSFLHFLRCRTITWRGSVNWPNPLDVSLYTSWFGTSHDHHVFRIQQYWNVLYFPTDKY